MILLNFLKGSGVFVRFCEVCYCLEKENVMLHRSKSRELRSEKLSRDLKIGKNILFTKISGTSFRNLAGDLTFVRLSADCVSRKAR